MAAILTHGSHQFIGLKPDRSIEPAFAAIGASEPELLLEMRPRIVEKRAAQQFRNEYGVEGYALRVGPRVRRHIQAVGAKLGCGLHYWETGQIVPSSGGIVVSWWTLADRMRGPILPPEIDRMLGVAKTLKQGKWTVENQFSYCAQADRESGIGLYFSMFSQSFAILSIIANDAEYFLQGGRSPHHIHHPGDFLSYSEKQFERQMSASVTPNPDRQAYGYLV